MESETKRTQRDYALAFKLAVVDQVEKGELTVLQARRRYGIQGSSTVLNWLRRYGRGGWGVLQGADSRMSEDQILTPEQRIRQLETQLKDTEQKARLFEAMLEVLKKDYGVSVVKKPLGKSSRKSASKA